MPVHTAHDNDGPRQTTTKTVTHGGDEHPFEGPPEGPFTYQGDGEPDPHVLEELLQEVDEEDVDHELPTASSTTLEVDAESTEVETPLLDEPSQEENDDVDDSE